MYDNSGVPKDAARFERTVRSNRGDRAVPRSLYASRGAQGYSLYFAIGVEGERDREASVTLTGDDVCDLALFLGEQYDAIAVNLRAAQERLTEQLARTNDPAVREAMREQHEALKRAQVEAAVEPEPEPDEDDVQPI
jgi:hypothetical protein